MSYVVACIIYIVLILLFNVYLVDTFGIHIKGESGKCHDANPTVQTVDVCPQSEEDMHEKARIKNCSKYSCNGEPFFYHCVKHISVGSFVEVCAQLVTITGNCCAEFDEELGKVREDVYRPCPECPFHYDSNKYIKKCMKREPKEETHTSGSVSYIYFVLLASLFVMSGLVLLLYLILKRMRYQFRRQEDIIMIENIKHEEVSKTLI